jgi:glutathione S-transferase
MADLVLYDAVGSPCARRVRIALLEKGLTWHTRLLDLTKMEQKRPEYLALNPNGVVPTLLDGDRVIFESNVITEYIDDRFPGPRLYPEDPWQRAQVKMWQAFELAMAKEFRPLMYHRVIGPLQRMRSKEEVLAEVARQTRATSHLAWAGLVWEGKTLTPEEEQACDEELRLRLDRLDATLAGHDHLVGDRFTIADVSVLPRVAMYPMIGIPIDPTKHRNLARWLELNQSRPSLRQSAMPQEG